MLCFTVFCRWSCSSQHAIIGIKYLWLCRTSILSAVYRVLCRSQHLSAQSLHWHQRWLYWHCLALHQRLSSPNSSIISVHFIPSSSKKKVIKVKIVALLFQPEEDIIWELRFCFGFHASHAHLGVGGLILCGAFVTHASNQVKTSDFPLPDNSSPKTGGDVQTVSRALESCSEGLKEQVFRDNALLHLHLEPQQDRTRRASKLSAEPNLQLAHTTAETSLSLCLLLSWVLLPPGSGSPP